MAPRRLPIGAEIVDRGIHVRVWAPDHEKVTLVIESATRPRETVLDREPDGYHAGFMPAAVVLAPDPGASPQAPEDAR